MNVQLFRRRSCWWPTWLGWSVIVAAFSLPILAWWFRGEEFFAITDARDADVLIVEAWISGAGIRASVDEFRRGKYRLVVVTGGLSGESWNDRRWDYALEGEEQLLRFGLSRDQVIVARNRDVESQRTYEMARAARAALQEHGIVPRSINVFTRGSHARRSRLLFSKVFDATVPVGVISWRPEVSTLAWWQSSERAEDLLKETVGYIFELLLNSARPRQISGD